ncbi:MULTISPECIES: GntR family transcriptional regulator [Paracoccus]|uniref:GntR family transcriptional regulator n=1 Tax=Paracoccus TaxID=265 RepID=UPI00078099B5|nr:MULTISPECIES: GntR family transcriptional regulator [Paracoccus]MCV2445828.1 GntR family transcriptional regulator [Paracoccus sp. DMF]MDQ7774609.1 GntR family transcriptional regulator [Paracoccus aminovorans]
MEESRIRSAGLPETPNRIERHSLHDAILTRLRDMIIEGELAPGTRINEGQVGAFLGVSRTPLREAIKFLASEGLIELIPSRGAVVKKFTAKEVRDMIDVIRTLEQHAGRTACATASDAGIAHVRALHDQMIGCYQRGDRLAYYKLNQAIHSAIVALADNAALADVHQLLQTRLKRIRFIGHEGPQKWAGAVAEHEEMIAALEARDPDRLAAIIGEHMDQAWNRVQDGLEG